MTFMTPERWRKVEELLQAARECEPSRQSAFLAAACAGDEELKRRVEELLDQERPTTGPGSLESGATGKPYGKRLGPGMQVGPYRLEAVLGVGGMGEVFKAIDPRLSRSVAIKVLLYVREFAAESQERFLQEARAASALNHPNIVTIYDVGAVDGTSYIVMELIDGQTLRDALSAGPLPTPKLLSIASQIGDALAT